MNTFQWDSFFLTGQDAVDQQHHHLVDLINQFGNLLMQPQGASSAEIEQLFGELASYTQYHFQEEEALMERTHLDALHLANHRQEHAKFLRDVTAMHADMADGNREQAQALLNYLTHWLAFHILGSDKLVAWLIAAAKAGTPADEAYRAYQNTRDPATASLLHATSCLLDQASQRSRAFQEISQTLEAQVAERTLELTHSNERLMREGQLLQTILDSAPLGIWMTTPTGRIQFVNKTFCNATGITEAQFLQAAHYIDVMPAAVGPNCRRSDQECLAQDGGVHQSTETLPFVDGKDHLLEISKVKLTGLQGQVIGVVGLAMDITERKQSEQKLQLAASVFTHAREGITITDAAGTIVDVNDTFTRITGYSREEALGQNPRMLSSGRQSPEFYAAMWKALADKGHWHGEVWNRRKNGELYAEMLTISAVRDSDGTTQHYVALFSDITLLKGHAQELERIANFDVLTQLPNRVLLTDRLQQAVLQCQRRKNSMAVVFLDLDGFKAVNDAHGHSAGDDLLITLSQRIKAAMREGDTLARVGGDEFVALLVDLDQVNDCEVILARMLQAASDPVSIGEAEVRVSASMGVTLYPQDGADSDILLRHADQAMYTAKQAGKNRYHLFDVAHDEVIQTHRDSRDQIRAALENQEFMLFYQPKVNLQTGAVVGAEALIRWQHPTRGLLSPGLFLHIVEDDPLGVALGEWVTETALHQMSTWRRSGLDIPVSVNIGARQLQAPGFVAYLSALLRAHPDVPPSSLELEVLETSALQDIAQVSEVMRASQALGVRFALDDFGTGYSSLTYLRRLPTATLKIDQSFVRDMLTDPADLSIVQGVIGLAQAFHCSVIAEGVETHAHGDKLLQLGCELAQGYGIARPMPAGELPGWVASWHLKPVWTA
jgi:diguanylate cyclase (GGDEF)-like protein/hemerythrin-like metal-binding protein/PAS domain S-box-containing protein